MSWVLAGQVILLGLVQGLTEFLPISSSGHLVLLQHFLPQISVQPVILDTFLHAGSLVALFFFFWPQWKKIIEDKKLLLNVFLATFITAVIVFPFKNLVEDSFSQPKIVGLCLLFTGFVLAGVSYYKKNFSSRVNWKNSVIVGLLQSLAVLPGISRSGITISAGIFSNLRSKTAIRFSFLLAIPLIAGAVAGELSNVAWINNNLLPYYLLGAAVSCIFSFWSLKFLVKLLSLHQRKLIYFALYCWIIGILTLILM